MFTLSGQNIQKIFISPKKERTKPQLDYFEKSIIISSLKETNAYIEENINDDKKVRKAPSAGKTGRQDLKTITERDSRFSVNKNDTKKA